MAESTKYIHGTDPEEQGRLANLNRLTNGPFLDFVTVHPGESVLEVGSGLGLLTRGFADRHPSATFVGLEASEAQLALARPLAGSNLSFVSGDAHALPFGDARFDVVYCRYLLEHVADPLQVLREMRRVLHPGGRCYVQENNIAVCELYPECPRFRELWRRFAELQARLGGDALIGRRLLSLLQ